jgi:hypothetical protein
MRDQELSWEDERSGEANQASLRKRMSSLPWWRDEVAPNVPPNANRQAVVESTAEAIRESHALTGQGIGRLLPGLQHLPDGLSYANLSVRPCRILAANSVDTWAALAERSAIEMHAWPGCGTKTVVEILHCAIDMWVEARWKDLPDPPAPYGARPVTRVPDLQTQPTSRWRNPTVASTMVALSQLCDAAYREGAENIGEALDLARTGTAAADESLGHIWTRFCGSRLDALLNVEPRLDHAWTVLLEFNERELQILEARCPTHPARSTLAALAREFGITSTRVGQIETRCRRRIAARLETGACTTIVHHAAQLRRRLGTLAPAAAVDAAVQPLLPIETPHVLLCRDIVLEQAGPYRLEGGFWQTGRPLSQLRSALPEQLDRLMDEAGIAVAHREACRAALGI